MSEDVQVVALGHADAMGVRPIVLRGEANPEKLGDAVRDARDALVQEGIPTPHVVLVGWNTRSFDLPEGVTAVADPEASETSIFVVPGPREP